MMSLVAYLNTLPPVKHKVEREPGGFPGLGADEERAAAGRVRAAAGHGDRVKYGEYLVNMAGCAGCHTQSEKGKPKPGVTFAGGERFAFPGVVVVSANITPDPQTGIGRWIGAGLRREVSADIASTPRNGSPAAGPENFTIMPWLDFSQLETDDLRAIYSFLRTQKPVYHAVDSHPGFDKRSW